MNLIKALISLPFILFFLYFLVRAIIDGSYMFALLYLALVIVIPAMMFSSYSNATIFEESGIKRAVSLRGLQTWAYDDIANVERSKDGRSIRMTFTNGAVVDIYHSEANLEAIKGILLSKCSRAGAWFSDSTYQL